MFRICPLIFFLSLIGGSSAWTQYRPPTELPFIVIDTDGKRIPDEPKVAARMRILDQRDPALPYRPDTTAGVAYDGFVGIELRGSSSKRFPKKGYGIETRRRDGSDRTANLLGMGREEDFVLHGPYSDKTLIRNAFAYQLAEELTGWAPGVRLVELMIDDDYRGVYLLTEKIKRDQQRIALTKPGDREDALTGGYVLKIDKFTGEDEKSGAAFASHHVDRLTHNATVRFLFHDPAPDEITAAQRAYITAWLHEFERVLASEDFAHPERGYRRLIDARSFADYFLLTELSRNVDGYRISTYFQKERDSRGGRLRMGPVWDFNIAFGNADYCDAVETSGWTYRINARCGGKNWPVPFWWRRMLEDPEFRTVVRNRWRELRVGAWSEAQLAARIQEMVAAMGDAPQRNHDRWQTLGKEIWPNAYVGDTYEAEIAHLTAWIQRRARWMDRAMAEW